LPNIIVCPICGFESENLTTHIIVIHNMSVKDFKKQFNINYVQSDRLRATHKKTIETDNPTKGKKRTKSEIKKMSKNRKGKGIGIAGKYGRTDEIKTKISKGVTAAHLRGDFDNVKPGVGSFIFCQKANRTIFARSTWEAKLIRVFDKHPRILSVENEPFVIPYVFEGSQHNYIPDFLVKYDETIQSVWEVKRDDFIVNDAKTKAKLQALEIYCSEHNMNMFIVDSKILQRLENYIREIQ
jgi:hypothetical protein